MKISLFSALFLAGHLCMAAPMPLPESNDGAKHVFATNQENFLMDGKPVKIISGEMHYPRVPREHWQDRFQRMKAMGMNTVCTYLFWNVHEPEPGKWDFSGNLDFVEFVKEAQKAGLWVIVRPGPYVCAEWEFGGFPGWLLKDADLKVRSQDPVSWNRPWLISRKSAPCWNRCRSPRAAPSSWPRWKMNTAPTAPTRTT